MSIVREKLINVRTFVRTNVLPSKIIICSLLYIDSFYLNILRLSSYVFHCSEVTVHCSEVFMKCQLKSSGSKIILHCLEYLYSHKRTRVVLSRGVTLKFARNVMEDCDETSKYFLIYPSICPNFLRFPNSWEGNYPLPPPPCPCLALVQVSFY